MKTRSIESDLRASLEQRERSSWPHRPDANALIILMTPRSGNTWLGDVLKQTGLLGQPEEYINPDCVGDTNIELNAATELDYLHGCLQRRTTDNGVFSMRTTWGDIERFETVDFLQFFAQAKYVWLRRRDIVDQAISLFLATESGRFHKGEGVAEHGDAVPEFDDEDLDRRLCEWIGHILSYENQTELQLAIRRHVPLRLYYEDFVEDISAAVRAIAGLINVELPPDAIRPSRFAPTRSTLNQDIKRGFAQRNALILNRLLALRPPLLA